MLSAESEMLYWGYYERLSPDDSQKEYMDEQLRLPTTHSRDVYAMTSNIRHCMIFPN